MDFILSIWKENNAIGVDFSSFKKIWLMLWLARYCKGLTTRVIWLCSCWCGCCECSRFWCSRVGCSRVGCCGCIGCCCWWCSSFDGLIWDTLNLNVRANPFPTRVTVPFCCVIGTSGESLYSFSKPFLSLNANQWLVEKIKMKTVLSIAWNLWSISTNRNRPIQITVRM